MSDVNVSGSTRSKWLAFCVAKFVDKFIIKWTMKCHSRFAFCVSPLKNVKHWNLKISILLKWQWGGGGLFSSGFSFVFSGSALFHSPIRARIKTAERKICVVRKPRRKCRNNADVIANSMNAGDTNAHNARKHAHTQKLKWNIMETTKIVPKNYVFVWNLNWMSLLPRAHRMILAHTHSHSHSTMHAVLDFVMYFFFVFESESTRYYAIEHWMCDE